MTINLLIIDSNLVSTISVKRALEQTRQFSVVPFTDTLAAVEYLQANPVDVAIVDMHMPDYPGEECIRLLLEKKLITVIASTSNSSAATRAVALGAAGLLDANYTAREVINLLEQILSFTLDGSNQDTSKAAAQPPAEPPPAPSVAEEDSAVFERLANEEPPLPSFEESGTITDLMALTGSDAGILSDALMLEPPDVQALESVAQQDTPARLILETAQDETLPMEQAGFNKYLSKLRQSGQSPSSYIAEPDFLATTDFENLSDETNRASDELQILYDADHQETLALDDAPPAELPVPAFIDALDDASDDAPAVPSAPAQPSTQAPTDADEGLHWRALVPVAETVNDPLIAQMAVSLTQASLESTAEATLLTRGDELIAYEGQLTELDIQEFMNAIVSGWESLREGQSRIRYLTLSSNGQDYMLFSRRTHEDFILSMVFAGKMALKEIRQQGNKLAAALQAVPEMPLVNEAAAPELDEDDPSQSKPSKGGLRLGSSVPPSESLVKYSFLWLLRDAAYNLESATAEAINAGLRVQLMEMGCHVEEVSVEEDYVFVLASIPESAAPQVMVRELQSRAANIAKIQNPAIVPARLWAESYFILSPGRALNVQEIQQYLNFYRL